jgi:hypothetical protein
VSTENFAFSGGYKLWKNLSFFVAIPGVALCMVNAYLRIKEHPHEAPEFKPYDHMRKRDKVMTENQILSIHYFSAASYKSY